MPPFINRALREPLVHFLVIGVLLFVVFALVGEDRRAAGNRIEIDRKSVV